MKKIFLSLVTIFGFSLLAFISQPVQAVEHSAHYYHRTSTFEQHGLTNFDVVFVGDSITERSLWAEMFPGIAVANRGIGGDRADGILERMDTILNTNAKKAFLMIGINDIAKGIPVETIYDNYVKIVEQLTAAKIEVIIQATLLTDRNNDWNVHVNQLNALVIKYAKAHDLSYVDLNPQLSENGRLKKVYSKDGLHLNGAAYSVWTQNIKAYMPTADALN